MLLANNNYTYGSSSIFSSINIKKISNSLLESINKLVDKALSEKDNEPIIEEINNWIFDTYDINPEERIYINSFI